MKRPLILYVYVHKHTHQMCRTLYICRLKRFVCEPCTLCLAAYSFICNTNMMYTVIAKMLGWDGKKSCNVIGWEKRRDGKDVFTTSQVLGVQPSIFTLVYGRYAGPPGLYFWCCSRHRCSFASHHRAHYPGQALVMAFPTPAGWRPSFMTSSPCRLAGILGVLQSCSEAGGGLQAAPIWTGVPR